MFLPVILKGSGSEGAMDRKKTIQVFEDMKRGLYPLYPDEYLDTAIEALSAEPYREADDYENEIADLHNRLDITEYDKERLREEVTVLEEKLKALSAEPCEDAISRQAAQDYIAEYLSQYLYDDVRAAVEVIDEYIGELPPVTPQQKMGHWILTDDNFVYCSECEDSYYPRPIDASWYYCPHCGAKMAESED